MRRHIYSGLKVSLQLAVIAAIFTGIYFVAPLSGNLLNSIKVVLHLTGPCQQPITYSIDSFDTRFGLNREDFARVINNAAEKWETATGKNLFEYSTKGELGVNLVYDYRQGATDQQHSIDSQISQTKSTYDTAKANYTSLLNSYNQEKSLLNDRIVKYNAERDAYDQEVKYWNARGGAKRDEYAKLEEERSALNAELADINQSRIILVTQADQVNQAVDNLNQMVNNINGQVKTYNAVGATTGKMFDEGEYIRDADGTRITIYQFDTQVKLQRVLEHELGHALGLEHIDNPKAVMYYLNQGTNENLTADDVSAIKAICKIK